jgi:hypothetical protein
VLWRKQEIILLASAHAAEVYYYHESVSPAFKGAPENKGEDIRGNPDVEGRMAPRRGGATRDADPPVLKAGFFFAGCVSLTSFNGGGMHEY